ncbi:hypothetical protein HQQ81_03840 [Microbacteriaceae bacterium VKM Ac-2854]|nr:hypothetical protein [Microbacteriaceae bacterium VKM Ac-2854]
MSALHGVVLVPATAKAGTATVTVRLLDVSLQDVAAAEIARVVLPGIAVQPGRRIPFVLEGERGRGFVVQAEVSFGAVRSSGDLLTVSPVLADTLSDSAEHPGAVPVVVI